MIFRIKTSKKTENILNSIKNKFNITPNILLRIAISLSLKEEAITKENIENISKHIDNQGLEFQRYTLTGENEIFYKIMMEEFCNSYLEDEEFFPLHFKFHMERGIDLLKAEIEIAPNIEMFLKNLINL